MTLNGLEPVKIGESYGDPNSDGLLDFADKYNRAIALVLTTNDRSLPNQDEPFTFEGDVTVLGKVTSAQLELTALSATSASLSGSMEVGEELSVGDNLTVGGTSTLKGDVEVQGSIVADSLDVQSDFVVQSLKSNNEQGEINLNGNKLVNSFQMPARAYELVNKQYVDQRVRGLNFFASVRVSDFYDPLSSDDVVEENDVDGNFTGRLSSASPTRLRIDNVDLEPQDRVLVTSYRGDTANRNGIYRVESPGNDSTVWVLSRSEEFRVAESMNQSELVYVNSGDQAGSSIFILAREAPFTSEEVFTRPIHFSPYQANVSVFSGLETMVGSEVDQIRQDLNQEISRLETSIKRLQQTVYPSNIETPVGAVVFGLESGLDDPNYLPLDGSEYNSSDYSELFDLIGRNYSTEETPNGKFRLPDLRGRFVLSSSDNFSLGNSGGQQQINLRPPQLPEWSSNIYAQGHLHDYEVWMEDSGGDTDISSIDSSAPVVSDNWQDFASDKTFSKQVISGETSSETINQAELGTGRPINNLPPYFVAVPFVKARRAFVANQLPRITWFSFSRDSIVIDRSGSRSRVEIYIELDLEGFSSQFLDGAKLEVVSERDNSILYTERGLSGKGYENRKALNITNLAFGENLLSLRVSEPTIPDIVRSTTLSYQNLLPENPVPRPQQTIDRNCYFQIISATATPQSVQAGNTISYRTQAVGVYHIQATIYHFPSNSDNSASYPGAVTGDIEEVGCRQLLMTGQWVVPNSARSGDLIAVEFRYWSPLNASSGAYRVETSYVDVI
jgi:microcystin-dependent protein